MDSCVSLPGGSSRASTLPDPIDLLPLAKALARELTARRGVPWHARVSEYESRAEIVRADGAAIHLRPAYYDKRETFVILTGVFPETAPRGTDGEMRT